MAILISPDDVFRILLHGRMPNGEKMLNVFHYEFYEPSVTDIGSHTLENFAFGFWENLRPSLRLVVSTTFRFEQVDAISLDANFNQINGESYIIPSAEQAGSAAGDSLPRFNCWTFKYVRPSLEFRHGWKRFGGVPEAAQNDGNPQGVAVTQLDAVAAALAADISGMYADGTVLADPGDARPVIYRGTFNGDPVTPVIYAPPASVVFNGVGTQNTRK